MDVNYCNNFNDIINSDVINLRKFYRICNSIVTCHNIFYILYELDKLKISI